MTNVRNVQVDFSSVQGVFFEQEDWKLNILANQL